MSTPVFSPLPVTRFDIALLVDHQQNAFERISVNGSLFYDRQTGELIVYDAISQIGQHFAQPDASSRVTLKTSGAF